MVSGTVETIPDSNNFCGMSQLLTSLDDFPEQFSHCALTVGNFDGVHRGHARLIQSVVEKAKFVGGPAVVLTFDPPPSEILFPERPRTLPLTTIARRAELLGNLGIDALIAYPTDLELLSLTPEEFFIQKIVKSIAAKAVVEGPNFRFGKGRAGDVDLLNELCVKHSMQFQVVEAEDQSGSMISSTRIRGLLADGQVSEANAMLTQPYTIEGTVAKGAQRGSKLGFPTANLEQQTSIVPGHGVYAGQVNLGGQKIAAAVHIGPNPTFGENAAKIEVHLIDWAGTIYGETLRCSLLRRIRKVHHFKNVEALKEQLNKDIAACRNPDVAGGKCN